MKLFKNLLRISVVSLTALGTLTSQVLAVTIGVFDDPTYVGTVEPTNLINTLTNFGHTITRFGSLDASVWQNMANNNQVIIIPGLVKYLFPDLPINTRNVARNYVNSGGGFMTMGRDFEAWDLMNGLFSFNIVDDDQGFPIDLNEANAAGTIFENGPSSLPHVQLTNFMSITSLPQGSISFYDDQINSTGLSVSPFGLGKVAYHGWDYSPNQQFQGWPTVTNSTVIFIAGNVTTTVPEPSAILALLCLGGIGLVKKY